MRNFRGAFLLLNIYISTGTCWWLRLFFGAKYQLSRFLAECITGFIWLVSGSSLLLFIFHWNACYIFENFLQGKAIHFLFWYCFDWFVSELRDFCLGRFGLELKEKVKISGLKLGLKNKEVRMLFPPLFKICSLVTYFLLFRLTSSKTNFRGCTHEFWFVSFLFLGVCSSQWRSATLSLSIGNDGMNLILLVYRNFGEIQFWIQMILNKKK